MSKKSAILKVIIERAMANTQGCINNITDINRATSVGEKAWHVHKYTNPLKVDKQNLEEDLQILSSSASSPKVSDFGSKSDYQELDKIIKTWTTMGYMKVVPFKKIKQVLQQMLKN